MKTRALSLLLASLLTLLLVSGCDRRVPERTSSEEQSPQQASSQWEEESSSAPSLPSSLPEEEASSREEPEDQEAVIHQILLEYGAVEPDNPPKEGWLQAEKGMSLYYYEEPWNQEAPMSPHWYYAWRVFQMWQEPEETWQEYSLPDLPGWFYPAEEYEELVTEHFPVTAQFLRDSDLYRADLGGYNLPGGGGIGATPWILLDHVEQEQEADGSLLVHLYVTLAYSTNDLEQNTYHILTARVRPDGSFQYVSWAEDPAPSQQQRESALVVLAGTPTQMDHLYTNEAYGFSLTLPESWTDHYTAEEGVMHYADGSQGPQIGFFYHGQTSAPLGYLHLVPLAYWETVDPSAAGLGTELARDGQYAYVYATWGGSCPYGPGQDYDLYQELRLEQEEESTIVLAFLEP